MKLFLSLAALVGVALAQNANIGLPTEGQVLSAGSDVVVQVQRPNTLTNSDELAIAIGISSCGTNGCLPATEFMGSVLLKGDFKPEYHETSRPPYQNFSVTVPSDFAKGNAQINVAHAALVGASFYPFIEGLNQSVTIA